jgi:type IV pilus assembly protein PilQ
MTMNKKSFGYIWVTVLSLLMLLGFNTNARELQDLSFATLPGGGLEVQLRFDGPAPKGQSYSIENPARITLDLDRVTNSLEKRYFDINAGNTRGATVISTKNKTRVVVKLDRIASHSTRIAGDKLFLTIGHATAAQNAAASGDDRITKVDFRRGVEGEGLVEIFLANPATPVNITRVTGKLRVELPKARLPQSLQRRLDVMDFATVVGMIEVFVEDGKSILQIEPTQAAYDYLAYQTDNKLTVSLKALTKAEQEAAKKDRFLYVGEKLSLDFQNIAVRTVLQIIADFTNFNLVVSDDVQGNITLRLKNVPWDQALEIILKAKGLAKRLQGNVLMVAPSAVMAEKERQELEANKQVAELAPLETEFVQIRYAEAAKIAEMLGAEGGLLSPRGTAVVDERTNNILIQDTAVAIEGFRRAVTTLDIPVRQVLVEARIVRARSNAGEKIGVAWGGVFGSNFKNNSAGILESGNTFSGSIEQSNEFQTGLFNGEEIEITDPTQRIVDLDIDDSEATSFTLGRMFRDGNSLYLLNLELSAIESEGEGEVVAQPRVITADGQEATIKSGREIPYEVASSSGATSITFKEAVLALTVTPRITPDDRVLMELKVNQDAQGTLTAAGPAIDKNEVTTKVLVANGETIVLGGIFQTEHSESVVKTPFLGDLPIIGNLFKKREVSDVRTELLIFITPKLFNDQLTSR